MNWQFKDSKISSSPGESGAQKCYIIHIQVSGSKSLKILRMLGPLTYGDYPDGMKRIIGTRLPVFSEEESELVKGSSDFVGVIHYLAASVSDSQSKPFLPGDSKFFADMGVLLTCMTKSFQ